MTLNIIITSPQMFFLRDYFAEDLAGGLNLRDRITSQLKTLKGIHSDGSTEGVTSKGKLKCPENAQNVIVSF
jgi:hypothetical protein